MFSLLINTGEETAKPPMHNISAMGQKFGFGYIDLHPIDLHPIDLHTISLNTIPTYHRLTRHT